MRELLYISDVMAKYQGKIPRQKIEEVVKKYDDIYHPRIKRHPESKGKLEKEMLLAMDSDLEKLLVN